MPGASCICRPTPVRDQYRHAGVGDQLARYCIHPAARRGSNACRPACCASAPADDLWHASRRPCPTRRCGSYQVAPGDQAPKSILSEIADLRHRVGRPVVWDHGGPGIRCLRMTPRVSADRASGPPARGSPAVPVRPGAGLASHQSVSAASALRRPILSSASSPASLTSRE